MQVALIGCNGFVGSSIKKYLIQSKHTTTFVDRRNFEEKKNFEYDIVINAAMPSKRFWAKNNPDISDLVELLLN